MKDMEPREQGDGRLVSLAPLWIQREFAPAPIKIWDISHFLAIFSIFCISGFLSNSKNY